MNSVAKASFSRVHFCKYYAETKKRERKKLSVITFTYFCFLQSTKQNIKIDIAMSIYSYYFFILAYYLQHTIVYCIGSQ